jgi:dUTPase
MASPIIVRFKRRRPRRIAVAEKMTDSSAGFDSAAVKEALTIGTGEIALIPLRFSHGSAAGV